MAERDRFELDLAAAVRAYLEEAPTQIRPSELARQFATAYPHRRTLVGRWSFGLTRATAWVLLLAGLLLALAVGGLVAGSWRPYQAVVIAPSPAQTSPTPGASATGSMTSPRKGHTATLLPDGRVLVAGGNLNAFLASAETFDPTTGTFLPTGSMSSPRIGHTASLLPDGRVLVAGSSGYLAELYDPKTGTFSATGTNWGAREAATVTLLPDGRVLVAGGVDDSNTSPASADVYDPTTGSIDPTGPMAAARSSHTATLLPDGRVLVVGGIAFYGGFEFPTRSAELYDPRTGNFSATGRATIGRIGHTATLLADGRVLVAGGLNAVSEAVAQAEIYDPKTGSFSATGSLTSGRMRHTATLLPDGRVLLVGGDTGGDNSYSGNSSLSPLATVELYDPKTGSFSATGSMATARSAHTATLLPDGRVLIAGGQGNGEILASAEVFDPATGTFAPAGP